MEEENERFVIEHEGEEHLFEELFRYTVDETDTSYIVLIPADQQEAPEDDEEEVEVFAFRYEEGDEDSGEISFYPIETDEEWDQVEEMLNTFTAEEGE